MNEVTGEILPAAEIKAKLDALPEEEAKKEVMKAWTSLHAREYNHLKDLPMSERPAALKAYRAKRRARNKIAKESRRNNR